MELRYACPDCRKVGTVASVETRAEAVCPACGGSRPLRASSFGSDWLLGCPVCGADDLYVRKDVPRPVSLATAAGGFAAAAWLWSRGRPLPAFLALLASAVADLAVYALVPDVTICYRCLSRFRGRGARPDGPFKPFDFQVAERYRREQTRAAATAAAAATPTTPDPAAAPGAGS